MQSAALSGVPPGPSSGDGWWSAPAPIVLPIGAPWALVPLLPLQGQEMVAWKGSVVHGGSEHGLASPAGDPYSHLPVSVYSELL